MLSEYLLDIILFFFSYAYVLEISKERRNVQYENAGVYDYFVINLDHISSSLFT